jgi:hypothetical protein
MYLLPPNRDGNDVGRKPLIAGGDTVMIAAGAYQFGLPFNGGSWGSCSSSWVYDCHMQPVPSGTAAQPTRIIGAGSSLTSFWGSGGASFVVNLAGSSNVVIQGVEITDHSNCIQNHTDATVKCQAGGLWAATGISDTEGGADTPQSSNVTLSDVRIHGMAKFGLLAGDINSWTLINDQIIGNGFGGWSLDTGKSFSAGTNTITNVEIGFNGCTENYPSTTIYACWGQQSGGYGDGVGSSGASDQGAWNFSQISVHDNVQDGIDFLHANPSAIITLDRVTAKNNAGNQLKGNGSATIQNSVVIGNCSAFVGKNSMQGNNSGGGGTAGDICRAQGDAVVHGPISRPDDDDRQQHDHQRGQHHYHRAGHWARRRYVEDQRYRKHLDRCAGLGEGRPTAAAEGRPLVLGRHAIQRADVHRQHHLEHEIGFSAYGHSYADPRLTNETIAAFDPTPTSATPSGVGAVAAVTPPPVTCNGGVVVTATCYCPVNTTLRAGTCGPLSAGRPVVTWTQTSQSSGTTTTSCQ